MPVLLNLQVRAMTSCRGSASGTAWGDRTASPCCPSTPQFKAHTCTFCQGSNLCSPLSPQCPELHPVHAEPARWPNGPPSPGPPDLPGPQIPPGLPGQLSPGGEAQDVHRCGPAAPHCVLLSGHIFPASWQGGSARATPISRDPVHRASGGANGHEGWGQQGCVQPHCHAQVIFFGRLWSMQGLMIVRRRLPSAHCAKACIRGPLRSGPQDASLDAPAQALHQRDSVLCMVGCKACLRKPGQ